MLTLKNIRKLALFSSYLFLVAILCLKVLVPLSHNHENHNRSQKGFHASSVEDCFACNVEHAAYLFSIETVAAYVGIVSYLGTLLLLSFTSNTSIPLVFSLLRGPPACSIQA